ncbi:hypothetical protein BSAF29S_05013 [Bacillus safensis subsp. safensis]
MSRGATPGRPACPTPSAEAPPTRKQRKRRPGPPRHAAPSRPSLFPASSRVRGVGVCRGGCRLGDHGPTSAVAWGFVGGRASGCGGLSVGLSEGMWAWSAEVLSLRNRGRAPVVALLVGGCLTFPGRRRAGRRLPEGERDSVVIGVDVGGGDRLALAVLVQYRMATTEQMHWVIAPGVRIEQTRRRLARLREEGLVERITLPQAGRRRVWFPTAYGVKVACEWPELRERRPSRTASDPTAVRLAVGHGLTVTETALAFLQDARRRGDVFRPLDWMTEVHHSIGNGHAVIPDALLYYRRGPVGGEGGSTPRAFVEVDRATMGPERLAAKLTAYARLHAYVPMVPGRRPTIQQPGVEELAAALSALPAAAVRPGRHRPRWHRKPGHRPARGHPRACPVRLPARGSRPRGAVGRPAPGRPGRTLMAPRPGSRRQSELVSVLVVPLAMGVEGSRRPLSGR